MTKRKHDKPEAEKPAFVVAHYEYITPPRPAWHWVMVSYFDPTIGKMVKAGEITATKGEMLRLLVKEKVGELAGVPQGMIAFADEVIGS